MFSSFILDKEPPMIEACVSPNRIHLMETGGNRNVTWVQPEFYDNSGKKPTVSVGPNSSQDTSGMTSGILC